MTAVGYCNFYGIPLELIPLMEKLDKAYWYLLQSKKIILTEKSIILVVGYYSGVGANSKRVDLTPIVTRACVDAGYLFSAYNDSPNKRKGVKHQKVKIYFSDKTALQPITLNTNCHAE